MLATWSRLIPNYCNKEANAVLCTQGGTRRMSLPLAGFSTALPILARLTRYAAKGNGAMRGRQNFAGVRGLRTVAITRLVDVV